MATAHGLPTDVILLVFEYLIDTDPHALLKWKNALPLLKICQSWRGVGKRILYKIAFIRDSMKYILESQGPDAEYDLEDIPAKFYTNLDLIQQNGFLLDVQKLSICTAFFPSFAIISVLNSLTSDNAAAISHHTFERIARVKQKLMVDGYISDTYNDQIIEVYSMAAQNMASIIPNIRTVDFDFDFMDNFMKYFVAFLVSNYGQQLNDFVSRGISDFKHYPPFTSLINLNIWAGSVEATQLPQVCAKPLTTVIISTECEQFEWDMFYTDNISDTVSFDNLELLDITSNFILPEEDIQLPLDSTNISQKKLSFPLLKLLRLSGVSLKTEDIQSLLQSPLKELYCSGYPSQVLVDICGQILNNLESITLEVDDRIGKNTSLNSITNMNKIFASLHGVDKVCVIIKLPLFDHKLSSMFWPNLTHLELIANVEFEYIIQAISHMPDLVDMRIEILAVLPGFSERQMDFLDNLKQYYSKPSSSALQTLKVYGGFTDSSPRLVSAFDMLKWYFPNLVTIEFDQKADIQTW